MVDFVFISVGAWKPRPAAFCHGNEDKMDFKTSIAFSCLYFLRRTLLQSRGPSKGAISSSTANRKPFFAASSYRWLAQIG
jgi:hypothetical protein